MIYPFKETIIPRLGETLLSSMSVGKFKYFIACFGSSKAD